MPSKEQEQLDFVRFADAIGMPELKDAEAVEHNDRPDFLLSRGADVLGIELTEVAVDHSDRGSQLRQREAMFERFRSEAEERLKARGIAAEALIDLGRRVDGPIPAKSDVFSAAEQAVDLVADFLTGTTFQPGGGEWFLRDEQLKGPLDLFLDHLRVFATPGSKQVLFMGVMTGWAQDAVGPGFEKGILDKEKKRATKYVNTCSRCWLLLVGTGSSTASLLSLPDFDPSGIPPNGFERIYIFDRFDGRAKLLWQNDAPVSATAAAAGAS